MARQELSFSYTFFTLSNNPEKETVTFCGIEFTGAARYLKEILFRMIALDLRITVCVFWSTEI